MLKGHLDAIVLSVISSGAGYGYAIMKEISSRSQSMIELPGGTIYPILHRLENNGLIASNWATAPSGRKRRVYTLTESGAKQLRERCEHWKTFAAAINMLLLEPVKSRN
ncbi:MAG: PadR family transcriptional regulator [Paracoccus sp. (in: a-proteobacteria)]|jgi:PadR family transcriptional regulator PadR